MPNNRVLYISEIQSEKWFSSTSFIPNFWQYLRIFKSGRGGKNLLHLLSTHSVATITKFNAESVSDLSKKFFFYSISFSFFPLSFLFSHLHHLPHQVVFPVFSPLEFWKTTNHMLPPLPCIWVRILPKRQWIPQVAMVSVFVAEAYVQSRWHLRPLRYGRTYNL